MRNFCRAYWQAPTRLKDRSRLRHLITGGACVIDLICSKHVPYGVKRLADHLKSDITKGEVVPFFGQIYDQKGELKNKGEHEMKPSDIMKMDWLVDNVVGSIPPMSEFVDNAKMVVELKGVEENKL